MFRTLSLKAHKIVRLWCKCIQIKLLLTLVCKKTVEFPLQVGNELLLQVQKSILGVLSLSEERVEWEIIVDAVVVKRELAVKVMLLFYTSVYIPTFTYGHYL